MNNLLNIIATDLKEGYQLQITATNEVLYSNNKIQLTGNIDTRLEWQITIEATGESHSFTIEENLRQEIAKEYYTLMEQF